MISTFVRSSAGCVMLAVSLSTAQAAIPPGQIQQAYDRISPAICVLRYSLEITNNQGETSRRNATSLGLIVSPDGLLLANGHMQLDNREPENIRVAVGQGQTKREYAATLLEKPDEVNISMLRINGPPDAEFPWVTFEHGVPLELGDPVVIIGVLGRSLDFVPAVQNRTVGAILQSPRLTYCLDEPISFGYVGGPVITRSGDIAGIIGFDLAANEGGDVYTRSGHPLIFQPELFQKYIDNPPTETVRADDAWLGIYTQPLTDEFAEYWQLPQEGGIIISTVIPDSPAEAAGLQSGDVIIRFNDAPVRIRDQQGTNAFIKNVRDAPIGTDIPIQLYRDGELQDMALRLGNRPTRAADAAEFEDENFGLTVRELTTDVRIALNATDGVEGVVVSRVISGGTASLARIRPGYLIMALGPYQTPSIDAYKEAVQQLKAEQPRELPVFCRVGANTAFFRLQPRWDGAE